MKIGKYVLGCVAASCMACSQIRDIDIPDVNNYTPMPFYRGVTMSFASYLEEVGGETYKEGGVAKDPYYSVRDHGGNMIRLLLEPEGFVRTPGMDAIQAPDVDWQEMKRVKKDMLRAKQAGLEVFLTLKPEKTIARCWLNDDGTIPERSVLGQKLYDWCYATLDELYAQGTLPAIVSIGNETNAWFMVPESYMEAGNEQYDYEGNVYFLNRGLQAVRDFCKAKGVSIKTACHIFSPSNIRWWCQEHYDRGLKNCDILALSWYVGYPGHSMGEWKDYASIVQWLRTNPKMYLFLLETSYPYTLENADKQTNVYYADQDWATGETSAAKQRAFLSEMASELNKAGALGMITWGNESLPTDCYIYANDDYGRGSSWDNNSYWDASCNLHEGIDWMKSIEF